MVGCGVRILADARCVRQGRSGVGYSAEWMLRALDARVAPGELHALTLDPAEWDPPPLAMDLVQVGTDYESHPAGELFSNFRLPAIARAADCAVIWGPAFVVPWMPTRAAKIAGIHDALVFEHPGFFPDRFARYLRTAVRLSVSRADAVLCHTQATADSLRRLFPGAGDRIHVIAHAADPSFSACATRPDSLAGDETPYILALGGGDPRKNAHLAVAAFTRLIRQGSGPRRLVLVGGGPGTVAVDGVHLLPRVSRQELRRLFSNADLFVFPSLAEGFGMPLLEAMACGCPVAASEIPVMREVAGDAAEYFDPRDERAAARAMVAVLDSPDRRDELRSAGAARTAAWSWDAAASKFLHLARELATDVRHGR
jgi:glycosyltransferase involved in cell wall biosynthesis